MRKGRRRPVAWAPALRSLHAAVDASAEVEDELGNARRLLRDLGQALAEAESAHKALNAGSRSPTDLKVPARDAQIMLGHAHISTMQQIYTHVDEAARLDALTRLNNLLGGES